MNKSSNEVEPSSSSKNMLLAARVSLIRIIRELNLFSYNPCWSPILTRTEQIYSTRLFLIFISISLFVVISYASLSIETNYVTLKKFSIKDFERLESLYPSTINIPCSEVSMSFNKFMNFSPQFHQICSSEFIGKKWISSLFLWNATSHNILDFRTFAFSHFRSLRLLCHLARQSVNDIHRTFNSTPLVHRYIFSRAQFNEIASVLFLNFQRNIVTNEKRTVTVVSMLIAQNGLFSALRTNYFVYSVPGSKDYTTSSAVYLTINQTKETECDCKLRENQCIYPAGAFYNWTLLESVKPAKNHLPAQFQIPGLMAGCIPLDSMRQSTLECLYNQSCVNAISLQPKFSGPFKALNASLSRFPLNSTIESIFNESLFVESWGNQSSFENYYAACAPQSLSYSYQTRFHLSKILTMSVSAFGGLVLAWQLITPLFIKIWKRIILKKQQIQSHTTAEPTAIEREILRMAPKPINKEISSYVHRTIHNFNLFSSDYKNNSDDERIGIIATRFYIFFVIIGLIILGCYTLILKRSQTYTIEWPSLSQFEKLNSKYSSTLNCPCSHFSMSYSRIMPLYPRYHSICSSEYLKDYWLSYFGRVEIDTNNTLFISTDFRITGKSFFNLLNKLCEMSNETIESALRVFRVNRLITINALSSDQFNDQINKRLKRFQQQTIASFVNLIELIRSSIDTNQLADETWTKLGPLSIYNNDTSQWSFHFRSRDFYTNSCSCIESNQCTRPAGFYFQTDNVRNKPNITIPGLVLACYAIDTLLLSTLECFYQKKCIKLLIDNYDFDIVGLVRPLDKRAIQIEPLRYENSRFYPNTTINEFFLQLFVEDWINSSNYTSYYTRCAPSQCVYTIEKRFDIAYMLTTMLGFYGGLSVILEIILPPFVKIIIKQWSKRKTSRQSNNSNEITTSKIIIILFHLLE
ncbi:unnamed protein product [Rotaria sp. Silwood1]|nr:unnamed protein product [Rotaria sp. Silwood1]CAF4901832.1 unnamed protein product [Rotaria sp. Silwood1]